LIEFEENFQSKIHFFQPGNDSFAIILSFLQSEDTFIIGQTTQLLSFLLHLLEIQFVFPDSLLHCLVENLRDYDSLSHTISVLITFCLKDYIQYLFTTLFIYEKVVEMIKFAPDQFILSQLLHLLSEILNVLH
jgi:hypothetical protein